MRRRLPLVVVLALVALAIAGLGAAQAGANTAYATSLSSACTSMRTQIEALGKPSDTPISKVYPGTVKIGRAFLKQVKQLHPPRAEQARAAAMVREYGFYFDGLALAYALLTKRHSQQGFIQTAASAVANLHLASGYARKLGAPVCARQPFD
jgi:hypothetical protein